MGEGMCHKCMGIKFLVLGLIFVGNYWALQNLNTGFNWWLLIGLLMVVGGIVKMVKPHCGCKGMVCGICGSGSGKAGKRK